MNNEDRRFLLIGIALLVAACAPSDVVTSSSQPPTTVVTTTDAPATSTTAMTTTSAPTGPQDVRLQPAGHQGPGATLTLSMPDGWTATGPFAGRGPDDDLFISYWYVANVFGDRCNSAGELLDPAPGPTVEDLAAAFVEAWGPYATAPVDADLGGYSGKYMVLTLPTVSAECPSVNMNGWMETGATPVAAGSVGEASRYYIAEGQVEEIWILDVDGDRQVVNASHAPGTSADDLAELQEVVDSIRIEPAT